MKAFRFARMMSGYANRQTNNSGVVMPFATALLLSPLAVKTHDRRQPASADAKRTAKVLKDELKDLERA